MPDPTNVNDLRDSQTIQCQWDTEWNETNVGLSTVNAI